MITPPSPYKECNDCNSIKDCPHPDVESNGFGTPITPENCPKKDNINLKVNMIFSEYVQENREEFVNKVIEVSGYLNIKPEWLMFLMWFETAKTMSPRIENYTTHAIGLIQFMPDTAKYLGTSTDALRRMTNVQQLEYVEKHLAPFRKQYKDWVDLYCAIFWPSAVGKPNTFRITPDIVAKQNPIFDENKDLDIEKSEIRSALKKQVPEKYKSFFN